jgi:hypothetical protein
MYYGKRFVVEGYGKLEKVTLTRRRGVAEKGRGENQRQNERGDSGEVRWAFGRASRFTERKH